MKESCSKTPSLQKKEFLLSLVRLEMNLLVNVLELGVVSVLNFHDIDDHYFSAAKMFIQSCLYLRKSTDAGNNHMIFFAIDNPLKGELSIEDQL